VDALPDPAAALGRLPLGPLLEALDAPAWVVGGWVRDVIAGREPGTDLDVAVEGDLEPAIERLEAEDGVDVNTRHERFGTATVRLGELSVDLARSRRETYAVPGALPDVEPAPIAEDLARRDFTVNAIALALRAPHELLDPFGGADDVRSGTLRVLHNDSFVDDPTRAIRIARYAARLGYEPDPATLELLRATDLGTVSADRRAAELARLAAEEAAPAGFRLLDGWGLLEIGENRLELIEAVDRIGPEPPLEAGAADRSRAILLAADGGPRFEAALALAHADPDRPSEAVRLAAGHSGDELLLAAAAGCDWISDYAREWRGVGLEIGGEDLLAAGVPEGPAIGIGLRGALQRKLDGGLVGGREAELELALELAREAL
jgi:tRNA nucleotidyltransferase (CCA-adding enzyme)